MRVQIICWLHNHSMLIFTTEDNVQPFRPLKTGALIDLIPFLILYLEPKSVLIFLISNLWMQFLIPALSGQSCALKTTLTIQMGAAGAGL